MSNQENEGKGVSRQARGTDVTTKILRAALTIGEEIGFDALTVERIIERTGVAKTTIYRRWANVSAIVMDAFLVEVTRAAPIQKCGTARESFTASMKLLANAYRGEQGKILRSLLGRAQQDPKLLEAVKTRWVEPRRQIARQIVQQGIKTGELRPEINVDVVLDLLYGPLYHVLLVPYEKATISDAYIDAVVDTVFRGLTRQQDG
ncbi:MAG: TetR/AcrR family transcriptional regulator [Solidesulfovibrio sp.]